MSFKILVVVTGDMRDRYIRSCVDTGQLYVGVEGIRTKGEEYMATDPVCKISVAEKDSQYTSIFQGKSQWFCSAECKSRFDQNPEKYKPDVRSSATNPEDERRTEKAESLTMKRGFPEKEERRQVKSEFSKTEIPTSPGGFRAGGGQTAAEAGGKNYSEGAHSQGVEMRDRLVSQGKDLMGKAKTRSTSFLTDKIKKAADTLDDVAKVFRESADKFEERRQTGISRYVEQAAEKIESVSRYVRESDLDRLVEDAENFIQKKPVLVLGSVLAAGFLTARFLKSSREGTSRHA